MSFELITHQYAYARCDVCHAKALEARGGKDAAFSVANGQGWWAHQIYRVSEGWADVAVCPACRKKLAPEVAPSEPVAT